VKDSQDGGVGVCDDPADPSAQTSSREMEQSGSPVHKGRGFPALISISRLLVWADGVIKC
jgi:hypothetical protein